MIKRELAGDGNNMNRLVLFIGIEKHRAFWVNTTIGVCKTGKLIASHVVTNGNSAPSEGIYRERILVMNKSRTNRRNSEQRRISVAIVRRRETPLCKRRTVRRRVLSRDT